MRIKQEQVMKLQPTGETYTVELYTFDELGDDVRARIVDEYREERENDPYFSQYFADAYERDIWECVRALEKSITGARVEWRYNRWYSCDFDVEYSYNDDFDPCAVDEVADTGYYAYIDLCDAWNKHARRLSAIGGLYEFADYLCWDVYNEWDSSRLEDAPQNASFYRRADRLRETLRARWYTELESACDDVRNAIETLLRCEWEWYTSDEYARERCEDESEQGGESRACEYPYWKLGGYTGRVFYSDNRKWYTADGELYEQADINHECVSIVKTR